MGIQVTTDAEVMREAAQILLHHLSPTKVARFWAGWHLGQGDYLAWREEEFTAETVDSLYQKITAFQEETAQTPSSPD
jgi:hypothetical protein